MVDKINSNYVSGVVKSITAGANVSVDITDPENPVISASVASGDTLPVASANNEYVGWNGSAYVARQIQYSEVAGTPNEVTDFVSKASGGQFNGIVYVRSQVGLRNTSDQNRALLDLNSDNGRLRLYNDTGAAAASIQAGGASYVLNRLGVGTAAPEHDLHVAGVAFGDSLETIGFIAQGSDLQSKLGFDLNIRATFLQQLKLGVGVGDAIIVSSNQSVQVVNRSGNVMNKLSGFDSVGRIGEIDLSTDFDIVSGELVFTGNTGSSTDTLDDVSSRNGTATVPITINSTLDVSGQVTLSSLSDGMLIANNGLLSTQPIPNVPKYFSIGSTSQIPVDSNWTTIQTLNITEANAHVLNVVATFVNASSYGVELRLKIAAVSIGNHYYDFHSFGNNAINLRYASISANHNYNNSPGSYTITLEARLLVDGGATGATAPVNCTNIKAITITK